MAVAEIHLDYSPALGRKTSVQIVLPGTITGPMPVLYLLHGLSDDHTNWTRFTSLERYAEKLPFLIVMPDCERSWYVDAVDLHKQAFETYFLTELVPFIDGAFHTQVTKAGRFTAGLSMGGYGALHFALKHPDKFSAAASHSGAVAFASKAFNPDSDAWRQEFVRTFGPDPRGTDFDVFRLAELCPPADRPALRIDCGVDDFLIADNRDLHAHLEKLGYAHEYAEHPGAHNWAYWDMHIQDTLAFFAGVLGGQRFDPQARP